MLKERQIREAILRMRELCLSEETIEDFKKGIIYKSSYGEILPLSQKENNLSKRCENQGNTVYHVISNDTVFGLMLSFLFVSEYEEEWKKDREDIEKCRAIAFVENITNPNNSEFGSITLKKGKVLERKN